MTNAKRRANGTHAVRMRGAVWLLAHFHAQPFHACASASVAERSLLNSPFVANAAHRYGHQLVSSNL